MRKLVLLFCALVLVLAGCTAVGALPTKSRGHHKPPTTTTTLRTSTSTSTVPRATTTTTTSTTTTTMPDGRTVLWSAGFEDGTLNAFGPQSIDGGFYDSGWADAHRSIAAQASTERAHSGAWSMKLTNDTSSGTSGVRAFRWKESRTNRDAYYSAWIYVPTTYSFSGNLTWNVMQFKSRPTDGSRVDPVWEFDIDRDSTGMYFHAGYGWGGTVLPGAGRWYEAAQRKYVQPNTWVHIEARIVQSTGATPDGHVTFWQDGTQLVDVPNAYTSYTNTNYNAWHADVEFALNLYSDGMTPNPATVYFDDVTISKGN